MRRFVSVLVAAALVVACFAAVAAARGGDQDYVADASWTFTYGEAESNLGIVRPREEGEALAPAALAVDGAGNMYVADPAKQRVAVFDQDGEYAGAVDAAGRLPIDVVAWGKGVVYLDAVEASVVLTGADHGSLFVQQISDEIVQSASCRLSITAAAVWVRTGDGRSFAVADIAASPTGLSKQEQLARPMRGRFAGEGLYDPFQADGGTVLRYGPDGQAELTVEMHEPNLLTIDVVGQDASGAFYVTLDILDGDAVRSECRKYSSQGKLLACFDLPPQALWTTHSTIVTSSGAVYRMTVSDSGVTVTRYISKRGGETS